MYIRIFRRTFPRFIDWLTHSSSTPVSSQALAAAALRQLLTNHKNQVAFCNAWGLQRVAALVLSASSSSAAATASTYQRANHSISMSISIANMLASLSTFRKSSSAPLRKELAGLLLNLTCNDNLHVQLLEDGVMRSLLLLARSRNDKIRKPALLSLKKLAMNERFQVREAPPSAAAYIHMSTHQSAHHRPVPPLAPRRR